VIRIDCKQGKKRVGVAVHVITGYKKNEIALTVGTTFVVDDDYATLHRKITAAMARANDTRCLETRLCPSE